ncbi:MAG: hypothetical protein IKR14_00620 [Lachnospiraceae bacterium]|nr:hypothetical protein [Lachnospiraceae bacterium]
MKKTAWLYAACAVLALNFGMTAHAAGTADYTVTYTPSETMATSGTLTGVFQGIAPGETKEALIEIQNNSNHAANFSISQETVKALEDASGVSGGAYQYDVKYYDANGVEQSLLKTVAGGYSGNKASNTGLKDVTELKDYTLFSRLESGGKTYVKLILTVDGEAVKNNYKSTSGTIDLNFMASYVDPDTGKIIYVNTPGVRKGSTRYVDRIVDTLVPVGTGDNPLFFVGLAVLAVGIALILIGAKKRKVEDAA